MAKRNSNSTDEQNSRYVQGGETDRLPNRLDWWERRNFDRRDDDIKLTLSIRYNLRPDLLSFDLYGTPNLAWLILQYNNIVDINEEFITGKQIVVPSEPRVQSEILTKQPGGNVI